MEVVILCQTDSGLEVEGDGAVLARCRAGAG